MQTHNHVMLTGRIVHPDRTGPRSGHRNCSSGFVPEKQHGFTIVELMIAMTLSLFLLGAITFVVVNSNKNYNTTDSLSRLQENARFAMEFLTRDLRRTGHVGCFMHIENASNRLTAAFLGINPSGTPQGAVPTQVDGIENIGSGTTWSQSGQSYTSGNFSLIPSTVTNQVLVNNSDAVSVRYAQITDVAVKQQMNNAFDDVVVDSNGAFNPKKGDIVMLSNCNHADIFQVTDVTTAGGVTTLKHAAGASGVTPGNQYGDLSAIYGKKGEETDGKTTATYFGAVTYYVATNTTTGQRSLYRDDPGDGNKEVVEGVDSLQVLYGVADSPANANAKTSPPYPVSYVKADALLSGGTGAQWANVVSIRYGVLVSSMANTADGQYGAEVDTGTYKVNGETVSLPTGSQRRLHRVFENTVMVRNSQRNQ